MYFYFLRYFKDLKQKKYDLETPKQKKLKKNKNLRDKKYLSQILN